MDAELGRLTQAFERHAPGPVAILIAGDHGEGLGEHGEAQHGRLLYQATMHVPLLLVGPGVAPGVSDAPVSTRRVFHTLLDWAGLEAADSLRAAKDEVVLGEAMKPFLAYGWQPQVMAVEGRRKAIRAGGQEVYDVVADPREAQRSRRERCAVALAAHGAPRLPGAVTGGRRAPQTRSARTSAASSRRSATWARPPRPSFAGTRRGPST